MKSSTQSAESSKPQLFQEKNIEHSPGPGWRFMDMGRRVELAIKHTGLIRIGLTQVCSESRSALEAHLDVADSTGSATGRPSN